MKNIIFTIAAFLSFASAAFAQGSIEGTITDAKGKGVANVSVTVVGANGKAVATVKTDEDGAYTFDEIAAGRYKVVATTPSGYKPTFRENVEVEDDDSATVDLILAAEKAAASSERKTQASAQASGSAASVTRTDFSGTWKLDEQKSELGDFLSFAVRAMRVEQKEGAITFSRTTRNYNKDGDETVSETLSYDGKPIESVIFGGGKRKRSITWMQDQKSFVIAQTIYFERQGQTNEFTGTETYALSADGKYLTVIQTGHSASGGDVTTKSVYVRS